MLKIITPFFLALLLLTPTWAQSPRGEIQRFTLLHDRIMVDRALRYDSSSYIFNVDLVISSGVRTLINDLSNTSDSSSSQAQKQLQTLELMSKNVNTEKYIDALVGVGIPLPDITWKGSKFYNSLFYQFGAGISLSFNNIRSVTNPEASIYVRKEIKKGITTFYRPQKDWLYKFSFYQLTRADIFSSLTATQLSQDGEFFNLDDLNRDHNFYAADISYIKRSSNGELLASIEEFQVMSDSDEKSLYGTSPLLRTQYTWFQKSGTVAINPFIGAHYRKWYPLHRGFYGGANFKFVRDEIPFSLTMKASNQFLTFMPQFKVSWFHFSYTFKTPYRNPQDEVWVSTLHNLQIQIPFP